MKRVDNHHEGSHLTHIIDNLLKVIRDGVSVADFVSCTTTMLKQEEKHIALHNGGQCEESKHELP